MAGDGRDAHASKTLCAPPRPQNGLACALRQAFIIPTNKLHTHTHVCASILRFVCGRRAGLVFEIINKTKPKPQTWDGRACRRLFLSNETKRRALCISIRYGSSETRGPSSSGDHCGVRGARSAVDSEYRGAHVRMCVARVCVRAFLRLHYLSCGARPDRAQAVSSGGAY